MTHVSAKALGRVKMFSISSKLERVLFERCARILQAAVVCRLIVMYKRVFWGGFVLPFCTILMLIVDDLSKT